MIKQDYGTPFNVVATNATAALATKTGVANTTAYITDIAVSSDKAGSICTVKQGTTTIFEIQVGVGSFTKIFSTPLQGTLGSDVSITIDGTALCKSNMSGFIIG